MLWEIRKRRKKAAKWCQYEDCAPFFLFTINLKYFWLANPTKWQDCAKKIIVQKFVSWVIWQKSILRKWDEKQEGWRRIKKRKKFDLEIYFSLHHHDDNSIFFMSLQYVFIILQSPNSSLLFFMNYSCEFYLTSVCTFFPLLLLSIQVHKYLFYIHTVSSAVVVHHKLKIHMCLQKEVDT